MTVMANALTINERQNSICAGVGCFLVSAIIIAHAIDTIAGRYNMYDHFISKIDI